MRGLLNVILILGTWAGIFLGCTTFSDKEMPPMASKYHKEVQSDSIYLIVDEMPLWSECINELNKKRCSNQKFMEYIYQHIAYEPVAKSDPIQSMILTSFVIEKDGSISNVKVEKGGEYSNIDKVLSNMPSWIPGKQNGIKRRVLYRVPLRIHLE